MATLIPKTQQTSRSLQKLLGVVPQRSDTTIAHAFAEEQLRSPDTGHEILSGMTRQILSGDQIIDTRHQHAATD